MIKVNNSFLYAMSLIFLLLAIFNLYGYYSNDSETFFLKASSFFNPICMSALLLAVYVRKLYKKSYSNLKNKGTKNLIHVKIISFIILLLSIVSLAYFINLLFNEGFYLGKILFKQIITFVFGVIAIILSMYIYVNVLKGKPPSLLLK